MREKRINLLLFLFLLPLLLTACGGSSGDSTSLTTDRGTISTSSLGGVVVDPYINGAIFQEIAADGVTVLQRVSTPSDAQGRFRFQQALKAGSIIEVKVSNRGNHVGATNQVILRRKVLSGDSGELIVSPLTTLVANGSTEEEVSALLQAAGLTGFTASDIYQDPMAGLTNFSGNLTDANLIRLHAAMAVGNCLEAYSNRAVTALDLNNSTEFQALTSLLDAIQETLNASAFQYIHSQLATDPNVTNLALGDAINAAVVQNRPVIALVKSQLTNSGQVDPAAVFNLALIASNNMLNETKLQNQAPPVSSTPLNGVTLYATKCSFCHGFLTTTDKPGRSAAATQAAIDQNIGDMGYLSTLTPAEVQAIADVLPGAPVTDPGQPPNGTDLYSMYCAGCHGVLTSTNKPGRTAAATQAAIDGNIGNMGYLNTLTAAEVQAIADVLPAAPVVDPGLPPDGTALYASECAGCHGPLLTTNKPGRTAAATQAAIDGNIGNMGYLNTLTPAEVQAIADVLPPAPVVDPGLPPDGTALYASDCASCHGTLASTNKPERTATTIQVAIDGNIGNMGYLNTLTVAEVQAIADVLPAAPVIDPGLPPDGTALYASDCAGCHGALASTNKPGRTATAIQVAIDGNIGNMGYLSTLTTAEVQAIADVLPPAPVVDPGLPPDGTALYASDCASCHGALASTNKPGRSATAIQVAIDGNIGNMGYLNTLTTAEVQAIADVLPAAPVVDPGPDYSNCTACHAQPPDGNVFPNTAGAHAAHQAIASIGTNCEACHQSATHDGAVSLAFPAVYDAAGNIATDNLNGTCSTVSCHGGVTTPDWWSETINLTSECATCHSSGTTEYNSYNSGEHRKHDRYSCTVCHNSSRMPSHIGDLATTTFEVTPASTVGGSGTSVGSYSGGTCSSIACHGSERW